MIQPIKKFQLDDDFLDHPNCDGTAVLNSDPYLAPFISYFRDRFSSLQLLKKEV